MIRPPEGRQTANCKKFEAMKTLGRATATTASTGDPGPFRGMSMQRNCCLPRLTVHSLAGQARSGSGTGTGTRPVRTLAPADPITE